MFKYALLFSLTLLGTWAQADTLHYEIYRMEDKAPPTLIAKGSKTYSNQDFTVTKIKGTLWSKSLELEQGFEIGVSTSSKDSEGFGLWAQKETNDFSWEWFTPTTHGKYKKLQEMGYLTTTTSQQGLSSMTFDTDVSLRISQLGSESKKITYRVLIKQGSLLTLPPSPVK